MKSYYTKQDDGSAILEVISPDVRFGLNIELNPKESGWWYVEKDMSKNSSGWLPPEFQRLLTPRALDAGCSHAYSHGSQPADYIFCPWCGGEHQRQ